MVYRLVLLCLIWGTAEAQTYYNQTTINPLPPYSLGTSGVLPTYLNSYTITGAVTAASTTFTCVTGCASLTVGQAVNGTDSGAVNIYPATAGQIAAVITVIAGTTITTNIASNAATTPGAYTLTIGKDRWSTTSTSLVNTLGVTNLWTGGAALGNTTWADIYLSNSCDNPAKVNNCFLMSGGGAVQINNFWGARTSDTSTGGIEANISLAVNDDTSSGKTMWNHYWQTELLAGAGTGVESHALESTVYNFNSSTQFLDPYHYDMGATLENMRLTSGQPGSSLGTFYDASDAISILYNGAGFKTGILFGTGSLDEVSTTTPPAIALPVNYSISWYRTGQSYTLRTWTIFASDSTTNSNTLDLQAAKVVASMVTSIGTPTDSLTPGGIAFAGNYGTATGFGTTGVGIEVGAQTIHDSIIANSGTVADTYVHHIGRPTLETTGTGVTLINASTLVLDNAPAPGTNVTITNPFALRVLAGQARFDGAVSITNSFNFDGRLYESSTDPTIASGFNTGGSVTGSNTAAFRVTVGTGAGTTTGVLTLPAATTGWHCSVSDDTNGVTNMVQQTGNTTTSVTVTNFVRTTGVAGNFTNSDQLTFTCGAF